MHASSSMHSWNVIHWIMELCNSKYLSLCVSGSFSQIQSQVCTFMPHCKLPLILALDTCDLERYNSSFGYGEQWLMTMAKVCHCTISLDTCIHKKLRISLWLVSNWREWHLIRNFNDCIKLAAVQCYWAVSFEVSASF